MKRILLSLAALTLLPACGIQGDLERPDPLWNREAALRRECAAQAEAGRTQDPRCAALQTGVETSAQTTP